MPLFMDQHDIQKATSEDLALAHSNDLAVQEAHDVRFLTYWVDFPRSLTNCLVEAPNPDAVNKVHGISHGQLANRVIQVNSSEVAAILGRLSDPDDGRLDSAIRTFVFTDMVGSTTLFDTLGDQEAFKIVQDHDRLVRALLDHHHGREVKHTGDGFMLAFTSPTDSLDFSTSLQRELAGGVIAIRIGINTGIPVAEGGDFFGMAVTVAARLCELAAAGEILASADVVSDAGETSFRFTEVGPVQLKGRASTVAVFRLEVAY